jgi:ABC-type Zn uptake system ZnuABC Zn-binding protein ZnuA
MTMLAEQIRELDDRTAARLLDVIAESRIQEGVAETEMAPDMAESLRAESGVDAPPEAVLPGGCGFHMV